MATVIDQLAAETGVGVDSLRAMFNGAPNQALLLRVREYDAKMAVIKAEAARVAGEYQARLQDLAIARNALQAKIDASMGNGA